MSEEKAHSGEEPTQERRYGARVSPWGGGDYILVQQTSRLHPGDGNNPRTIDHHPGGKPITRPVRLGDCQAIAKAIRDALLGQL